MRAEESFPLVSFVFCKSFEGAVLDSTSLASLFSAGQTLLVTRAMLAGLACSTGCTTNNASPFSLCSLIIDAHAAGA
jgi:hypothetical protein